MPAKGTKWGDGLKARANNYDIQRRAQGNSGPGLKGEKLWRDALRIELFRPDEKHNVKRLQMIAAKVVDLAIAGDMDAIKEIGNRIDGKPNMSVEHTGDGGGPIQYVIIGAKEAIQSKLAGILAAEETSGISGKPH